MSFYLFHYYFDQCTIQQIEGNTIPTEVKRHRFLYHENTDIVDSFYESLHTEPINTNFERLKNLKIDVLEVSRLILYPKLSSIEYPSAEPITSNKLGKWMMFFEKKNGVFDQKWLECCKLYDKKRLTGIVSLMCTTDYEYLNFGRNIGAIFFLCASEDISILAEYAINLLELIDYPGGRDPFNMYYKKYEDYDMDNKGMDGKGKPWSYRIGINSYKIEEYYNFW